jgi:plastocyanin
VTRRFLVFSVLVVVLVACSDNHKVGTGVNTSNRKGGNLAIGAETTTTGAPVFTLPTTTLPPTTRPRVVVATTAPRPATTVPVQSFQIITINSDNSTQTQFSPSSLTVYVGTPVHWQNHDTKVRSVVADDGSFRSPDIPPGGEWVYVANTPGTFNYQDGTRPYAVGSLTVVNR